MRIESVARKLQPLRPDLVRRWKRIREGSDQELSDLMDQQLLAVARRVLGDYDDKTLLSLPPHSKARGAIRLGKVIYERPKWNAGISEGELLQHMAILGRSGSGKTNCASALLLQLAKRRVPFLILDWKQNYRHLIPKLKKEVYLYTAGRKLSPFPFNPFLRPPGVESGVYANQVVDTLAMAFTLGEGSKSLLQKALRRCYETSDSPTLADVLREIEALTPSARAREWKVSTLRALESLEMAGLAPTEPLGQQEVLKQLLDQNTILELDGLAQSAKRFLIPILCLWLFHVKLARKARESLDFVVFLEEAHHVLYRQDRRAPESVVNTFLRQCRELGIAVVVIDQHAHLLSSAALGNTFSTVILNQKDPRDINLLAQLALIPDDEKRCLSTLPVGQAIIKLQDRWTSPFLVEIPWVEIPKGAVTDAVVEAHRSPHGALSGLSRLDTGRDGQDGHFRVGDDGLDAQDVDFLMDVLQYPNGGVAQRYQRLGWSGDRGHRRKESLVDRGLLEAASIRVGRTRRVILRLSPEFQRKLGPNKNVIRRESLAHVYWKSVYAARLRDLGFDVRVEWNRNGGAFDILATNSAERVAFEIETGKSDVISNVKRGLASGVDRLVVVATDEDALLRVERKLAGADLIIPRRIQLVLRDEFFRE